MFFARKLVSYLQIKLRLFRNLTRQILNGLFGKDRAAVEQQLT